MKLLKAQPTIINVAPVTIRTVLDPAAASVLAIVPPPAAAVACGPATGRGPAWGVQCCALAIVNFRAFGSSRGLCRDLRSVWVHAEGAIVSGAVPVRTCQWVCTLYCATAERLVESVWRAVAGHLLSARSNHWHAVLPLQTEMSRTTIANRTLRFCLHILACLHSAHSISSGAVIHSMRWQDVQQRKSTPGGPCLRRSESTTWLGTATLVPSAVAGTAHNNCGVSSRDFPFAQLKLPHCTSLPGSLEYEYVPMTAEHANRLATSVCSKLASCSQCMEGRHGGEQRTARGMLTRQHTCSVSWIFATYPSRTAQAASMGVSLVADSNPYAMVMAGSFTKYE